uniref:N-acetylmuramoyl-L-alanine amidase n=1 Tax=Cacopsylla melanoneura TaxID=428564 RepID=A0A8D8RA19_9HEMI
MWQLRPVLLLCLFLFSISSISSQQHDKVKASIPDSLLECYKYPMYFNKDNLLPMTMNTLISLVRKIEDYQSYAMDMRTLSSALLHRFRLDGIERNPNVMQTDYVVPYTPSGNEFFKYKLLMDTLIPGSSYLFPNERFTPIERSNLHWMLSSSVDKWERGDEGATCGRLANYEQRFANSRPRQRREAKPDPQPKPVADPQLPAGTWVANGNRDESAFPDLNRNYQPGLPGGVNGFPDSRSPLDRPIDRLQPDQSGAIPDRGLYDGGFPRGNRFGGDTEYPLSACPVQNGVIMTKWGALKAGSLIAGIAAGMQPQVVNVRTLMQARTGGVSSVQRNNFQQSSYNTAFQSPINSRRTQGAQSVPAGVGRPAVPMDNAYQPQLSIPPNSIDNKWAATLAGDLAQLALLQGPSQYGVRLGIQGGWNDTLIPKYYFLREPLKDSLSEADIRGDMDGLLLALNVYEWSRQTTNLKLSQILDMYYSERGVFDKNFRVCRRNELMQALTQSNTLQDQTQNFAFILQNELTNSVNLEEPAISAFSQTAVSKLNSYIATLRNDAACWTNGDPNQVVEPRPGVELYLVIDCSWDFFEIQRILWYLIDQLEVSKYGSSVTLLNAKDGFRIINTTENSLDVLNQFNRTYYYSYARGFDFSRMVSVLRDDFRYLQDHERINRISGGRPRAVLFIPAQAGVQSYSDDRSYTWQTLQLFRNQIPDVNFMFLSYGTRDKYQSYVQDPRDVFTLQQGDIQTSIDPIIARLKDLQKRLINPMCGSNWYGEWYDNMQYIGYVEPSGINYYKISANYFYNSQNPRIRIQGQGYGNLMVCYSRFNTHPNGNNSYSNNRGGYGGYQSSQTGYSSQSSYQQGQRNYPGQNGFSGSGSNYPGSYSAPGSNGYQQQQPPSSSGGIFSSIPQTFSGSNNNYPPPGLSSNTYNSRDFTCKSLLSSDIIEIPLEDPCASYDYAYQCPPLYISVAGTSSGVPHSGGYNAPSNFRCSDEGCRYPDMIKYIISHEGLSCYSGVGTLLPSVFLMLVALLWTTSS